MRNIAVTVVREDSRNLALALGGCPLGGVDLSADRRGFFMARGIGASATSASVRIGLGASAGGTNCGVMSSSNWPG